MNGECGEGLCGLLGGDASPNSCSAAHRVERTVDEPHFQFWT